MLCFAHAACDGKLRTPDFSSNSRRNRRKAGRKRKIKRDGRRKSGVTKD